MQLQCDGRRMEDAAWGDMGPWEGGKEAGAGERHHVKAPANNALLAQRVILTFKDAFKGSKWPFRFKF